MLEEHNENAKLQEKFEPADTNKSYGWGIRHLQMACITLNLVCLIIARASMGIAVLAMSDTHQNATDIPDKLCSHADRSRDVLSGNGLPYTGSVVIGISSVFLMFWSTSILTVYDWDKKTQSLILSSFFWGYVVMQIPSGIVAKKFGGKPIMIFSILSNAILCLLVPTLAALGGWVLVCAARVTMGLTQACLFSSTQTLIGQWVPASERTNYTGIVFGGMQLGVIIAMPLCGFLAETAMGWKLIFYVTSGILIADLAIWCIFGASYPREHRWISEEEKQYIEAGLNVSKSRRPPTPWKNILRSKPVWALLAPHCAFAVCFVFFFVDLPTFLEKGLKISLKNSALLSALPYIGMWFGSSLSSYVSEVIYNKGLLNLTTCRKLFQSISLFGIAIALVMLSFLGPANQFLSVATLVGCLTMVGFSTAGFIINQLDLSPNYAGVIMSLLNFIATVGCALIPIVTSVILRNDPSDVSRWRIVFLLIAVLCVIANVLYLALATSDRQPWDDPNYVKKILDDPEELKPVLKGDYSKEQVTEK